MARQDFLGNWQDRIFDKVLNIVIAKLRRFRFSIELDENICYSFNAYIIIANVRIGYFVRVGNNVR